MGDYTERISTNVDEELKQKVRVEAAKRDMTMAEFVREVLKREVTDSSEGNPKPPAQTAD